MCVLLRADLTGPGMAIQAHLPKRVGWPCPVRSALKRTPMQDFDSFPIMFYYIISTTYQIIGAYFALFILLDFRMVCALISQLENVTMCPGLPVDRRAVGGSEKVGVVCGGLDHGRHSLYQF